MRKIPTFEQFILESIQENEIYEKLSVSGIIDKLNIAGVPSDAINYIVKRIQMFKKPNVDVLGSLEKYIGTMKAKQMMVAIYEALDIDMVSEGKYKGKEVFPSWIGSKDFGKPVKNIKELEPENLYIIYEPGMDNWQGEYRFIGKEDGVSYMFKSNIQFNNNDMWFTKAELEDFIKNGDIINQK